MKQRAKDIRTKEQALVAHHTPEPPAPRHRRCVLCGEILEGYGNNPQPIKRRGECCQKCNEERVIPARLHRLFCQ